MTPAPDPAPDATRVDIEWHVSDACLHLTCGRCGTETHSDRPQIESLTCSGCGFLYQLPRTITLTEARVQALEREVARLSEQLQHREFDVMTFCAIVGVEAEEQLEDRVRQLADIRLRWEGTCRQLEEIRQLVGAAGSHGDYAEETTVEAVRRRLT